MNPLVIDISSLKEGQRTHYEQDGAAPVRLGLSVIAIPEGAPVHLEGDIEHQGSAFMADFSLKASLEATCSQCGENFSQEYELARTTYALDDAPKGEDLSAEEEDILVVDAKGHIDLTQFIIDEMGTTLPFAPICGCEAVEYTEEEKIDPRWAGLEKFL